MANCKGLFGVLDSGTGTGVGITNAVPGTTLGSAITDTIASPAFIDDAGILVFPQLDSEGRIRVTTDESGECHDAVGTVTGSTSFQDVATFTAALLKKYNKIGFIINSMTECDWEIVYVDDVGVGDTETIIAYADTGPGQYTFALDSLNCVEIDTAAGTGVQEIRIRAKLLEATGAELGATLWVHEITE